MLNTVVNIKFRKCSDERIKQLNNVKIIDNNLNIWLKFANKTL